MGREEQSEEREVLDSIFPEEIQGKSAALLHYSVCAKTLPLQTYPQIYLHISRHIGERISNIDPPGHHKRRRRRIRTSNSHPPSEIPRKLPRRSPHTRHPRPSKCGLPSLLQRQLRPGSTVRWINRNGGREYGDGYDIYAIFNTEG